MARLDDPARLSALRATHMLEASADLRPFERIARLATHLLGTSMAAVSLVDDEKQTMIGPPRPGGTLITTPVSQSFCRHVVETEAPLRVDEARQHPLVSASSLIDEMGVEAYLGVPLVTPEGEVLGALCAIDGAPRSWTDEHLAVLRDLAAMVMSEAEARAISRQLVEVNAQLAREHEALREREERLRRLADAAFEGIAVSEGGIVFDGNEAFGQMFGYTHEEFVGRSVGEFAAPTERDRVRTYNTTGAEQAYETVGRRSDGSTFPIEVRGRRVPWGERTVRVTALRDLSERVAAEQERRLHTEILTNMREGVALVRAADAAILYANPSFEALHGYAPGELVGGSIRRLFPLGLDPEEDERRQGAVRELQASGRVQGEWRPVRKDGSRLWCRTTTSTMQHPEHGEVWVTVHEDITEQREASAALARQTAFVDLLRVTATEANEAERSDEAIGLCVQRIAEVMGWPVGHVCMIDEQAPTQLRATDIWYLHEPARLEPFVRATATAVLGPDSALAGRVLRSGQAHWLEDVGQEPSFVRRDAARACGLRAGFAFPLLMGAEVVGVLEFYSTRAEIPDAAVRDVMANVGTQLGRVVERERARARLERQTAEVRALSLRDELTGLYNRRGFLELARQGLRLADRSQQPALVLFIDLNGMKPINDRFGHEEGDRALTATAAVLRATFRESDVLARLGGDEFAVFAPDVAPEQHLLFADRLQAAVRAFNESLPLRPWRLSLSTGVSVYDPRARRSIEAVLEEADARMYEAKRLRAQTGRSGPVDALRPSSPPRSSPSIEPPPR